MKWWAQSFLVGVPRIVCGFRDDEGIVRSLQTFRTSEIPRETQVCVWEGGEGGGSGKIKFLNTVNANFSVSFPTSGPC